MGQTCVFCSISIGANGRPFIDVSVYLDAILLEYHNLRRYVVFARRSFKDTITEV